MGRVATETCCWETVGVCSVAPAAVTLEDGLSGKPCALAVRSVEPTVALGLERRSSRSLGEGGVPQ